MKIEITLKNGSGVEFEREIQTLYESIDDICTDYDIVDNVNIG